MKKAGIAYFTEQGGRLAHRIADGLAPEYEILLYEKGLKDWCAACFAKAELIIFIGACGIAVRTIAPLLKSKTEDPAVLVLDEAGQYVISLLSGATLHRPNLSKGRPVWTMSASALPYCLPETAGQ